MNVIYSLNFGQTCFPIIMHSDKKRELSIYDFWRHGYWLWWVYCWAKITIPLKWDNESFLLNIQILFCIIIWKGSLNLVLQQGIIQPFHHWLLIIIKVRQKSIILLSVTPTSIIIIVSQTPTIDACCFSKLQIWFAKQKMWFHTFNPWNIEHHLPSSENCETCVCFVVKVTDP